MSHPTKGQWARICDQLHRAVEVLENAGPLLFDRDQHTAQPDGYPTSSMGGDGRGGSTSTSVEAAILAKHRRDQVHEDARNLAANVGTALDLLSAAIGNANHAASIATDRPADHGPSGTCLVCERRVEGTSEDRLRRGMCHADYMAWDRAGRPDLATFRRERAA